MKDHGLKEGLYTPGLWSMVLWDLGRRIKQGFINGIFYDSGLMVDLRNYMP